MIRWNSFRFRLGMAIIELGNKIAFDALDAEFECDCGGDCV